MSKKNKEEAKVASDKEKMEGVIDEDIQDVEQEDQTSKEESQDDNQEDEMEELSETDALKEELSKEKDKFLRLFAEFENYKRRTSKERVELFKTAGQEVMQAMLPVLDDFDRALKELKKSDDDSLYAGVNLINNKLKETLKAKGLEQMAVKIGDSFDSELHDAITQIEAPKKKLKGKIVDVVEKGYTLGDKIIRFPKVVTGK